MCKYTVFVSAFRATLPMAQNIYRTASLAAWLTRFSTLKPAIAMGHYQEDGQEFASVEQTLVLTHQDSAACEYISLHAGQDYQQDSILVVDTETNAAWLYFSNGQVESLGSFVQVSEAEAVASGIYTFVNDKFYVCK